MVCRVNQHGGTVILFAAALISCSGIDAVTGLQCYSCTYSATGSTVLQSYCNDPFSTSGYTGSLVSCSTSCYKTTSQAASSTILTRGCWDATSTPSTCSDGGYSDGSTTAYLSCCTADKCNGSGPSHTTTAIFGPLAALTFLPVLLRGLI